MTGGSRGRLRLSARRHFIVRAAAGRGVSANDAAVSPRARASPRDRGDIFPGRLATSAERTEPGGRAETEAGRDRDRSFFSRGEGGFEMRSMREGHSRIR